jgi:predicted PurR-regulated permease PerM
MDSDNTSLQTSAIVEAMIRVGLIFFLIFITWQVFAPFSGLFMWASILAVALYPLHLWMAGALGGRNGLSATLIVLIGLIGIGWPMVMLGSAFASTVHEFYTGISDNTLTLNPPSESIAEWPLVGEKLYTTWAAAAADLPAFIEKAQPQLTEITKKALGLATGTMGSVLLFLSALVVAGIMMAFGETVSQALLKIFNRVVDPGRGGNLLNLSTSTIRSVATGVIGVAFIQALLLGIVYVLADIPFAAVLAVAVLLVGIIQIPATVVSIPVIIYLWMGDATTTSNLIWTVLILVAGLADNVLKPLLLGRGVDAPMPIILIGALGGMVAGGMVGMFVGAVMLAVGYVIFMDWVNEGQAIAAKGDLPDAESTEPGPPT